MRAELVFVGTELLLGEILNTNAQYLGQSLAEQGVDVEAIVTVGDHLERIAAAIRGALDRVDLVVCCGGLGPTLDDLTREAVAAATGRPLELHPPTLEAIRRGFERRRLPFTENNARQAMLPAGAEPLPNPYGSAPGIALVHEGRLVFCLPGPPRELVPMWEREVLPRLAAERARRGERPVRLFRRVLKVVGLPESLAEERIRDLVAGRDDPAVGIYAKPFLEIHIRLATKAVDAEEAEGRLAPLEEAIRTRLGPHVYGRDEDTLPAALGRLLRARGLRLAVAESCTGGLVGHLLTEVPGSSEYFLGSLVCYANRLKEDLLDVDGESLRRHGAVSEPVARLMARGVQARTGADVALAITGIAGPGGGTPEKPVGTVWFCVRDREREWARTFRLPGTRQEVKQRAAGLGLALLWGFLQGLPEAGVPWGGGAAQGDRERAY